MISELNDETIPTKMVGIADGYSVKVVEVILIGTAADVECAAKIVCYADTGDGWQCAKRVASLCRVDV